VAEVERCLRAGIDVARRQGARLYELRATVSLARLLKRQDKPDDARAMLAEIYNWFTDWLRHRRPQRCKSIDRGN
jgi:hypothetical protein